MALTFAEKEAVVADVANIASNAMSVVSAEYRGLSVSEMTELRQQARDKAVDLRVVRNTLSKRALEGTDFEPMRDVLTGPVFLAFSQEAPGAAARLLRDFAKDHNKLEVKHIALSGQLLDATHLERVASLPTKDEALSKLLFVMKEPVAKLARGLQDSYARLARVVGAVRDQKQS